MQWVKLKRKYVSEIRCLLLQYMKENLERIQSEDFACFEGSKINCVVITLVFQLLKTRVCLVL